MKNILIALGLLVAVGGPWGWFWSKGGRQTHNRPSSEAMGDLKSHPPEDQLTILQRVPESSPDYAKAQEVIGYTIFGQQRGDWTEAKRHVDLALKASPNDPQVLDAAGRVYLKAGKIVEGEEMLKRAKL